MGPLELFAILVLAGAIVILLYFYIQEMRGTGGTGFSGVKSSISDMGNRVSEGISSQYNNPSTEGEKKQGVSERVSEMGERLRGKVKDVPISTDVLSGRIDEFLNEQSDRLIQDWELATKSDVDVLEKKYGKVVRDIEDLEKRFSEYRGHANKKFESIEKRVSALEGEEPEKSE